MLDLEDMLDSTRKILHEFNVETVRLCLLLGSVSRPLDEIIRDEHQLSVLGIAAQHFHLIVPYLDDFSDDVLVHLGSGLCRLVSVQSIAFTIISLFCGEFCQERAGLDNRFLREIQGGKSLDDHFVVEFIVNN